MNALSSCLWRCAVYPPLRILPSTTQSTLHYAVYPPLRSLPSTTQSTLRYAVYPPLRSLPSTTQSTLHYAVYSSLRSLPSTTQSTLHYAVYPPQGDSRILLTISADCTMSTTQHTISTIVMAVRHRNVTSSLQRHGALAVWTIALSDGSSPISDKFSRRHYAQNFVLSNDTNQSMLNTSLSN